MYLDRRFKTYKEQKAFLLDARVKCDASLLFFTKFFFKELRGSRFVMSEHHYELEKNFHDLENYKLRLLSINIPPRCSKTELALNYVARGIGKNPSSNWLYITASDELRAEVSSRIRDIVTHPFFKMMYSVELKKDQNSKNLWKTTEGGGLKTATIFGQILGFGAGQLKEETLEDIRNFEGCVFMDDIDKADDSEIQNANSEKVKRTVFNTVLSRINSFDTPFVNIQQRVGMTDITNAFMEHYGLESPLHRFVIMPIIKEDGTSLYPTKYPLEEIEKLKTSPKTAHVFETQYMQNPLPAKGVLFNKKEMNFFTMDELRTDLIQSRIGNIDVAGDGKDFYSFPSGVLIGELFYVTEWIYTQESTEYTRPVTASLVNANKLDHLGFESNNFGMEFGRQLKTELNQFTTLYPKFESKQKLSRIINKAEFIRKHFVFRKDVQVNTDYYKALEHLFRYMKDGSFKIDDAPDSLAGLAHLIQDLQFPQFKNI